MALPILQDGGLAPGWSGETPPVLCLGARTPLDTAAAEILAQLLRRHGVPCTVATSMRLAELGRIDLSAVKLVWLSSLDAALSNAHIRFVIRRLRRSSPELIIGGAFWGGSETSAPADEALINLQTHDLATAVRMTLTLAGAQEQTLASDESETSAHKGAHRQISPAA